MGARSRDVTPAVTAVLLIFVIGGTTASGSEREVCQQCHADTDLERELAPASSVFVDDALLDRSIHEGMECTDCHVTATECSTPIADGSTVTLTGGGRGA